MFDNDQDIGRLADKVSDYMESNQEKPMFGYLIRGHGFYIWGQTAADAVRHVEAFEFLFECEIKLRKISGK